MRAVVFDAFATLPDVREIPDPACAPDGIVVGVAATGLCRSDWHGWMGHDPDIALPHVPGHEFAGTVVEVGRDVGRVRVGDRVTAPFVCACGACPTCRRGDGQVCERQQQPGFTYPGSYAQFVAVPAADVNAVALPADLDLDLAAGLGCRVATSWRAVIAQGRVGAGDDVVIVGCGGVGLAAVAIAVARGARVVAVDISAAGRQRALDLGAAHALDPADGDVAAVVHDLTGGGATVSLDAIGGAEPMRAAVESLRPRGRHVQVGLLGGTATLPAAIVSRAVARELEIVGSHGMAAADYPALLVAVTSGDIDLAALVTRRISLDEAPVALAGLSLAAVDGVTLIVP